MAHNPPPFQRLTKDTSFFFVRHGESVGNADHVIQGRWEYSLSEKGKDQARRTAGFFVQQFPDLLLTSPLRRARETAQIIGKSIGYGGEPQTVDNLKELDTGIFSGYTFEEVPELYPEEWRRFRIESWESVPEAESVESLYGRAAAVWEYLIDTAEKGYRRIVSVTHGGLLQWIFRSSLGGHHDRWMPLIKGSNCGIFQLSAHPVNYDEERHPADGFYAEWRLVNHRPGLDAPVEDYSSLRGPKG
jgi:broad specificity phosphatase PhoE